MERLNIRTQSRTDFQDITPEVQDIISRNDINNGICHIFIPHTTAGVTINEHADPSVMEDIAAQMENLAPQHGNYRHMEGNSPAHMKSSLVGNTATVFVEQEKLVMGTWQGIFFCEFDGPRTRSVLVKVTADQTG
ncbi:secondary thiamine-phosphate synthase enzyme YjbQ [Chloroflexota bacterium]